LIPDAYLFAIPLASVNSWFAGTLYAVMAIMWLVPDRPDRNDAHSMKMAVTSDTDLPVKMFRRGEG
jgi:putative Ca2+/H+ antiporter (TMEM165/GDT1 family)